MMMKKTALELGQDTKELFRNRRDALKEIRDMGEGREEALRKFNYNKIVRYYNDGRPVKYTETKAEQATRYQLEVWKQAGGYYVIANEHFIRFADETHVTPQMEAREALHLSKNIGEILNALHFYYNG